MGSKVFAVLCTGPSMSQAVADSVRELGVVAVNSTYQLAPWADAIAANDARWWKANPEAMEFTGRKFSISQQWGLERILPNGLLGTNTCSGVLGLEVAKRLGAQRILLLGCDMRGTHYFGDYPPPLKATPRDRRKLHVAQFQRWRDENVALQVYNCTPGSALTCFPRAKLEEVL